ncbi:hypothetical protein [Alistipes finegoldii]|jgi:hypothetical protein|uniref:hypothetical protein n=1 Tax=Alistipes finegoldii TaxID=214856 RepID=UPI002666629F|nr:hypothetical protein [Alistipes finegoldii]
MKISEIYNLQKSQAELDFVDIDVTKDLPLFVDPFFLSKREDAWSMDAVSTLRSFFQQIINFIKQGYIKEAKELFGYLKEPNVTCLGLSRGKPQGRGVGHEDTDKVFNRLLKSKAISTGLIQDIEDNILFIDKFGKDKLSDMTTNIILNHLIKYTQNQCNLHNIPMQNAPSGYFWDKMSMEWRSEFTEMLVCDGRKIVLVPKGIVSFCKAYMPDKYYNHFVLNYLQQENIRLGTTLVYRRRSGVPYVTKKSIKQASPYSKDFLIHFTKAHPEVLRNFKNRTHVSALSNEDIYDINVENIAKSLSEQLMQIPMGNEAASQYHNMMIGVLELIFYPHLINPYKEQEIHEGRKRIDIVFENAAEQNSVLDRLISKHHIPCQYIFFECKNYSRDVANPELDQLSGRFSPRRGRVGFLLCRNIDDFDLFIQRCKDTYNDDRGLIIPLVDNDIISLLNNVRNYSPNRYLEDFLSHRVAKLIL